jgi:hypothetical protein
MVLARIGPAITDLDALDQPLWHVDDRVAGIGLLVFGAAGLHDEDRPWKSSRVCTVPSVIGFDKPMR